MGGKNKHKNNVSRLDSSIVQSYAIQESKRAHDNIIKLKQNTNTRKRLIFPHLQTLLFQRKENDIIETNTVIINRENLLHQNNISNQLKSVHKKINSYKQVLFNTIFSLNYPQFHIKTLTEISIETIAKCFSCYELNDIQYVLDSLFPESIEKLFFFTCKYNTQTNNNMIVFSKDLIQRVYISSEITDEGMELLTNSSKNNNNNIQIYDSWEDINDNNEYNDLNNNHNLQEFYFFSSKITTNTLLIIHDHYPFIYKLCLYDIRFSFEQQQQQQQKYDYNEQNDFFIPDPIIYCLNILKIFSSGIGYQQLITLDIYYCEWIHYKSLELWCKYINYQRQNINILLLNNLKFINIYGYQEYRNLLSTTIKSNNNINIDTIMPDINSIEINQLILMFYNLCNIKLQIE